MGAYTEKLEFKPWLPATAIRLEEHRSTHRFCLHVDLTHRPSRATVSSTRRARRMRRTIMSNTSSSDRTPQ